MAKLKGPLFSLGATAQLGKALVYFPWKGLNLVREYVVPSNPRTSGQVTQRGYLRDAVDAIHGVMGHATFPLGETDTTAYSLWGSTFATPRTWFNQCVKNWMDMKVAGKIPLIHYGAALTPAAAQITLRVRTWNESGTFANANVKWGTSKTALINTQAVTAAQLNAGIAITGMATKTKYFLQVESISPDTMDGNKSGIYHATTT